MSDSARRRFCGPYFSSAFLFALAGPMAGVVLLRIALRRDSSKLGRFGMTPFGWPVSCEKRDCSSRTACAARISSLRFSPHSIARRTAAVSGVSGQQSEPVPLQRSFDSRCGCAASLPGSAACPQKRLCSPQGQKQKRVLNTLPPPSRHRRRTWYGSLHTARFCLLRFAAASTRKPAERKISRRLARPLLRHSKLYGLARPPNNASKK